MTRHTDNTAPERIWPRELWMAEREEHDQGVVTAVLSQFATVARWAGDPERDREFHHYVDADILESQRKYYEALIADAERRGREAAFEQAAAKCQASVDYRVSQIGKNVEDYRQRERWIAGRVQAEICRDAILALRTPPAEPSDTMATVTVQDAERRGREAGIRLAAKRYYDGGDWDTFATAHCSMLDLIDGISPAEPSDAVATVTVREKPTRAQLVSACTSYRHDFGLMEHEMQREVELECAEWWRCVVRALAGASK